MRPPAEAASPGGSGYADAFAPPLLDPDRPPPSFVKGPGTKAAVKRYAVYRNNVTVSLIEALADTFPAVRRIVGDQFFRDLARVYVRSEPPVSPLLFEYGQTFAAFIEGFEHTQRFPWLGDVARIERAWLNAYHAADRPPLAPEALAAVAPEALASAVFAPHPATYVLRSSWPAVTIFSANRQAGPVGKIAERDGEDALVTRPALEVQVRTLPPGGAAFLAALIEGASLGSAADRVIQSDADFDLAANITGMIEAGAFSAVTEGKNSDLER